MPGLARKLLIFAAVDGLILQPYYGNNGSSPRNSTGGGGGGGGLATPIQIEYKTRRIYSLSPVASGQKQREKEKESRFLESHGIIGGCWSCVLLVQREQVSPVLLDNG